MRKLKFKSETVFSSGVEVKQGCRNQHGQGGRIPSQILADQLTLYEPWGVDYALHFLVAPSYF